MSQNDSRYSTSTIYAVGGGKGGIGKSFISANLGFYFAQKNFKTLIVDLDFGGANAHTYLKVPLEGASVRDYLSGNTDHLGNVVVETPYKNLSLIRGAADWDEVINLDENNLSQLFRAVKDLDFQKIIFDLGAGVGFETIEGYLAADARIAVCTPEPISIENTYQFLKRVFYRQLQRSCQLHDCADIIENVLSRKQEFKISTPFSLISFLKTSYPEVGGKLFQEIKSIDSSILVNQARSPKDQKLAKSLSQISRQYFGFSVLPLGHIDFENRVWQSIRAMKPLFVEAPQAGILQDFKQVFERLEKQAKETTEGKHSSFVA